MEAPLNRRSPIVFAAALGFLAATSASRALAFEGYQVASPVVRDNLAVYFVHGRSAASPTPQTLDQALARGDVRIHESAERPVTIENLSGQSVFIQLGTLIKGGLQDQVVAQDVILPPHSGLLPLSIFCVDPFRSTPRGDEDATTFTANGTLFPSRMARLTLLAAGADSKPMERLRQSGIWWSIDTARGALAQAAGEALEPPQVPTWQSDVIADLRPQVLLGARQSSWRTSLPLALENQKLATLLANYPDAFAAKADRRDVIGAVFVVNGKIEGAEIYQSHRLFGRMWPGLLRAYATQAIAAGGAATETLPPVSAVKASLAAAARGELRADAAAGAPIVRDSDAAIFAEARTAGGNVVHRSLVPKRIDAIASPDALVASILQAGTVDGRPLAGLDSDNVVVLSSAAPGTWSATVAPSLSAARIVNVSAQGAGAAFADSLRAQAAWHEAANRRAVTLWAVTPAAGVLAFLIVLILRRRAAIGRLVRRVAVTLASSQGATLRPASARTRR